MLERCTRVAQLTGLIAACAVTLWLGPACAQTTATSSGDTAAKTQAEIDKLKAETKKLEGDDTFFWGRAAGYGAMLAAIGALIGVFVTVSKNRSDRQKDIQAAAEERERERMRRFDEQFGKMVDGLTSDKPAPRASAAAAITTFLRPEHAEFHDQVLMLLLANLKFPRNDASDRLVGRVFAQALREHRDRLPGLFGPGRLDLNDARLREADLSDLDLTGCDMEHADLQRTDLSRAQLFRAEGHAADLTEALLIRARLGEARLNGATLSGAHFGSTRLVSAKLRGAKAVGTSFDGAFLQDAHLHGADLRTATFRGANVNNTFFLGARLDESALASIVQADNWRKANWDPDVFERLKVIAGTPEGPRPEAPPQSPPAPPPDDPAGGEQPES
jgi:uncharacterized protein YjbI with pentapeptide repeats